MSGAIACPPARNGQMKQEVGMEGHAKTGQLYRPISLELHLISAPSMKSSP